MISERVNTNPGRLLGWLHEPVAAHSLVMLRVAFGGLMVALVARMVLTGQVERLYLAQTLHFKYRHMGWVPDPMPVVLYGAFAAVVRQWEEAYRNAR